MVHLDSAETLEETAPREVEAREIPIRFRLVESVGELEPVKLLKHRDTGREVFLRDIREDSKYRVVFVYGEGENHNEYIEPMNGKELRQQVDCEFEFSRSLGSDEYIDVYLCETGRENGGKI